MKSATSGKELASGEPSVGALRVAVLTRTRRQSGARFAFSVGRSVHHLCGIMAERRSAMLWRSLRRLSILGFLRKYSAQWLLARASEAFSAWAGGMKSSRRRTGHDSSSAADAAKLFRAPYMEVGDLNSPEVLSVLRQWAPDVLLVANAPVLKPHVLDAARLGGINFHSGRLPEYGGVASEFWALYEGKTETWVTLHSISAALDSGDILAEGSVAILPSDTPETLHDRCVAKGVSMIGALLDSMAAGSCMRIRSPGPAVLRKWPSSREYSEFSRRRRSAGVT